MIKGVALGVTLKNAHRQVLIDQTSGNRNLDGAGVYQLSDHDTNSDLGTIIFYENKDNWDYKGPLSHGDIYKIARFIQNYSDDDWNF